PRCSAAACSPEPMLPRLAVGQVESWVHLPRAGEDLPPDVVLHVLREHWDPSVASVAYLSRGAGAHHWVASGRHRPRWFVTADVLGAGEGRLEELLDTY